MILRWGLVLLCAALLLTDVQAQNAATTKAASYFTVDAAAPETSTQNWWGDNVDNGAEPTTAAPPSVTGSGVSPASATGGDRVAAAGVLPAESGTVTGVPDTSTPITVTDDGNSTQSSSTLIRLESGALLLVAFLVMH